MAATLTVAQIALIRLEIGDSCDKYSDAQLQTAYDAAEGDDCGTRAIILRWVWASVKPQTLNLADGSQRLSYGIADLYKKRLDYWEGCWDNGGNTLQVGVLALGLDVTEADLEDPNFWGYD